MRPVDVTLKILIAIALASLLLSPALASVADAAQPFKNPFPKDPEVSLSSPLTTPGDLSKQPTDLLPPDRCPPGHYYNPNTRQCVPIQARYAPGGAPACPDGYYYDPMRRQCMPETPNPMGVPMAVQR